MILLLAGAPTLRAAEPGPFRFESIATVDAMTTWLQQRFPLGTPREQLRHVLEREGQATRIERPADASVEKYLYDIDLCHFYVWRWNVSADYDAAGRLVQLYLDGEPVHAQGTPKRVVPKVAAPGKKASIVRMQRPRPEAFKGERSLGYILFDADSDTATREDQALIGTGPSRVDPADMGRMISYSDVDPWRSIFDVDSAARIVPWTGSCATADRIWAERALKAPKSAPTSEK
jgi:hypothetical protein